MKFTNSIPTKTDVQFVATWVSKGKVWSNEYIVTRDSYLELTPNQEFEPATWLPWEEMKQCKFVVQ